jgi:hypothetical protein
MDAQDMKRRIIGFLTLTYNTLPQLKQGQPSEEFWVEFGTAMNELLEGWSNGYPVQLHLSPGQREEVQAALHGVGEQFDDDVRELLFIFATIFARLCQEVEGKYPDVDIAAFLRRLGLEAAKDKLPANFPSVAFPGTRAGTTRSRQCSRIISR